MPRRIACWLAFAAASVAVLRIGWAGPAGHPATVLTRVDVVAAVLILAVAPWPARRRFGPTGPGWLARAVRVPATPRCSPCCWSRPRWSAVTG